jgi:hypothetical protein
MDFTAIQQVYHCAFKMRRSAFLWSLASLLAEAVPLNSPAVKFISPSKVSPGSAQNVVVEYGGDVDGHLTLSYGACGDEVAVSETVHHIGSTHVGQHPLATRHLDHQDKRPTRFVWLTSEDISGGCLSAFLDGELIGQSDELEIVKRLALRGEKKKSFADVAGDDSLWFDGVAYLKQKQPDDFFVTATKNKTFGILGGGMSGLLSSVSNIPSAVECKPNCTLSSSFSTLLASTTGRFSSLPSELEGVSELFTSMVPHQKMVNTMNSDP